MGVCLYVVAPVLWCGCLPVCVFHQVCVRACGLMCVYVCSRVFVGQIGGSCLLIRIVKDGDCMVQSEVYFCG